MKEVLNGGSACSVIIIITVNIERLIFLWVGGANLSNYTPSGSLQ